MNKNQNESFEHQIDESQVDESQIKDQVNEDPENENQEIIEEDVPEVDELAETKAALTEAEDRYLRLQAELANIRKRTQKEKEDAAKYRSQSLATELLPVIDSLERAMSIDVADENGKKFKEGLNMVVESFNRALENEGIKTIDPLGESFDPHYHQAVQTVPREDDQAADTVVNVLQKGYSLNERVLRPAMVVVAQ